MKEEKKGYVGQISHSGTNVVKAPVNGGGTANKGAVIHSGSDLRTGKK